MSNQNNKHLESNSSKFISELIESNNRFNQLEQQFKEIKDMSKQQKNCLDGRLANIIIQTIFYLAFSIGSGL